MVPIQYGLLYAYCHHLVKGPGSAFETVGLTSAMGIACGVLGINVAHELGHRRTRFERILARALLCTSLNWQFYIEHNRGHHLKVSTPDDSESAHLNESIYAFWFRAVTTSYQAAWKLDPIEMIIGTFLQATLAAVISFNFGSFALLGFFASAGVGILLLQSVNYIEHYGLSRTKTAEGRFESVKPHHSWNSDQILSRAVLFELSRHSDHHANALRKYPALRHFDSSPELPTGYPGMILLALIPRLWFARMNPKITPASVPAS
jgi:alkane 1-monooxygenase